MKDSRATYRKAKMGEPVHSDGVLVCVLDAICRDLWDFGPARVASEGEGNLIKANCQASSSVAAALELVWCGVAAGWSTADS